MHILVSNDDGVYAKGLAALALALSDLGKVTVIAPDRNRSGASNSLTLDAPVRVKTLENNFISVEGTPTDCVHLALTGLVENTQDIVVSGINESSNLGDDVWYSGTVAAAIEGRFLGLPAIAMSLVTTGKGYYYETAAEVAKQLVQKLSKDRLPGSTILNVNVPDVPYNELQGFEVTRLGTRHKAERVTPQLDPRGHPIYWIGPAGSEEDAGPGTDFYAVKMKKVSITPLNVDITHYSTFDQLVRWIHGLNG